VNAQAARIKMALAAGALVALAGGFWYSLSVMPLARTPGSKRQISMSASAMAAAHRANALPTIEVPNELPPASAAAPEPISRADLPEASAPPLEDMIERAMPAVVMIETPRTRGSGFFVKPDLIVTNAHVISGFQSAAITTREGAKLTGRVAESSDQHDVALIQVPGPGPTNAQLPLGNSASLRLGQGIVALGWAESLAQSTVTRGIVTGLRRDAERNLLQTDAVPNPGDSGGPLLDRGGEVVGVTTFRGEGGTSGYAITIDDVKPFVARVNQNVMTAPVDSRVAPAAPPQRESDADARRTAGLQRYTDTLSAVERSASDLDFTWSRYKSACQITTVPPGQSHEWFGLYDSRSPLHQTPPHCADRLAEIERRAREISTTMSSAGETARQADVYPGPLRALREKRRLDYSGWDR
jgi:S1-C subfamily serine protease